MMRRRGYSYRPPARGKPSMRTSSTALTKKQKEEIAKYVKRIQAGTMEKKIFYSTPERVTYAVGDGKIFNLMDSIPQGTDTNNRVGNIVHLDSITVRLNFNVDVEFRVDYRIFVFWSDEEFVSGQVWGNMANSVLSTTFPFVGTNTQKYVSQMHLNEYQAGLVYTTQVSGSRNVTVAFGGINPNVCTEFTMNFKKKKITFKDSGVPSYLEGRNLYLAVLADTGDNQSIGTSAGKGVATIKTKYYE